MSANLINPSNPYNSARATLSIGGDKYNYHLVEGVSGYAQEPMSFFNAITNEYQASWSNGTGTLITPGGSMIFTASGDNGSLNQLLLANRGSGTVYFGVNSNAINIASGGTILGSGESIALDGPITALWAYAGVGNSVLNAMGIRRYNSDMAR